MDDTAPRIVYDIEFQFRDGGRETVHVEEARGDRILIDDTVVSVQLNPEPGVSEDVLVTRAELAFMRTIRREIQPEVTVQDAGSTRIVHPRDVH